ncbi:LysR family transcriptional regulator [Comamonadaceae bacterium OH2545_COT-014]|nr:LysR family transcriptional regulator [Comamonadaceae bacterium OH2545_COT-014]
MTPLDWNDVQHFVTLVEQQTLSAAAEALNVQHSTVSRRVAQLEARLGLRLFDRIGKRYRLTGDGQRLYEHARALRQDMNALLRLAHAQRHAVAEVAVSAPPVALRWRLLPQLPAFYARHPRIRLRLQGSAQLSNLHERQADIALRLVRPEAGDLAVRRLGSLHFGFYASAAYLRRTARSDWRFLTLSTQNPLSRWAADTIGSAHVALACNDFELIRQGLNAGLGVGLLPADSVGAQDALQAVAVNAAAPETLAQPLYLVMHDDVRRSPSVRAVADFLAGALAAEGAPG